MLGVVHAFIRWWRQTVVEKRPLDRLKVQGFMSLRDVDLRLRKLNVLIGPNGAGKSNFVSYFRMLREMVEGRLQLWVAKRGGANRVLTFGAEQTRQLSSSLDFGSFRYDFELTPTDADRFVFADERAHVSDGTGFKYVFWNGHEESLLKNLDSSHRIHQSICSFNTYQFHNTSETARVKLTGALNDNLYLRSDASNLAAYLYLLKSHQSETFRHIGNIVRLAAPFFDDFVLEPFRIRPEEYTIQLQWRSKHGDEPLLASQLSDGSLRFICLVTALMQPDPHATIIIDEPEIGLHPYAITLLGSLLHSASERMQVIAATQSPRLLDAFSVDNLVVLELEDGASVFKRLAESDFDAWLDEYSVGELWEKNVLGGRLS